MTSALAIGLRRYGTAASVELVLCSEAALTIKICKAASSKIYRCLIFSLETRSRSYAGPTRGSESIGSDFQKGVHQVLSGLAHKPTHARSCDS